MEPRLRPATRTLNKIVETMAQFVIPGRRLEDLWDLAQAHPPAYAYQLADCTVRAIIDETERALYPAIAIHRGAPRPEEKRKRLNEVSRMLSQSVWLWLLGAMVYIYGNAEMIPDVAHLRLFAVAVPSVILAMAVRFHLQSWTTAAGVIVAQESISLEGYRQELRRKKESLFLEDFSPSKFPLRSGAVVLTVMLMGFPPGYIVLRWSAGDPLPSGLSWVGIWWRVAMALVLFALFLCIRKSNKLAAEVFQQEIDALDPARIKPMSA